MRYEAVYDFHGRFRTPQLAEAHFGSDFSAILVSPLFLTFVYLTTFAFCRPFTNLLSWRTLLPVKYWHGFLQSILTYIKNSFSSSSDLHFCHLPFCFFPLFWHRACAIALLTQFTEPFFDPRFCHCVCTKHVSFICFFLMVYLDYFLSTFRL